MKDPVYGQGAGLAEPLATVCTLERLVFGVNVFMVPQVVGTAKCLATNVTRKGTLVRVCSFVDQQVVTLGELPVTELADESLLWSGPPAWRGEEARIKGSLQSGPLLQPVTHDKSLMKVRGKGGEEQGSGEIQGRGGWAGPGRQWGESGWGGRGR